MSSIPLPALDVRPPAQQQDPLEQYGRLLALKNQMANAPLQNQALQQQVQAGQLENQQKQQSLKDQQAMTTAMQQWDGKDLTALAPLVLKNGGSAQAVMGLKQKQLEMQQTYSKIASDDAITGEKTLETQQKRNDMIAGRLSTVAQLPDDQLGQGITSAAQDLIKQGLLDPQHGQSAAQLAQLPPDQARLQLDSLRKGLMTQSQLMDEALKNAEIGKDNAQGTEAQGNTLLTQSKLRWAQQHGMAPGVSPEEASLADYLQKNPGKGASDYTIWKAQHSPTMIMQGMSQGASGAPSMQSPQGGTDWGKVAQRYGLSQAAFDQQAEKYYQTGQLPPIGRGNANVIAQNRDLMNRAADLHPNASLAEGTAEYKANSDSLKKLQASLDQVTAFEGTANKNIGMLEQLGQKIPDLGTRFANTPVRVLSANLLGTENMAAFRTALAPVQAEAAKILNSANLSGQLSDSSRHELQGLVDGNLPYKSLVASLNTLQQDFKNRHDSTAQQVQDIQNRMRGGSQSQQPGVSNTPQTGGVSVGSVITQNGHRYKVAAVDRNGKPTSADLVN